jgi:hypothetical protein
MERTHDQWLKLLELHQREYHFNVQLGTQRQVFYIGLNTALLGTLAGFAHGPLASLGYAVGAATSLLGAKVVRVSHGYYVAARVRLQAVEQAGELMGFVTTPGQAGDTGRPRVKVTSAAAWVLYLFAVLNVVAGVLALS